MYAIPFFKKNWWISKKLSLNRYLFGKTIRIVHKKSMLKECIQSYFLHGSIFCLGNYMSVSKPSICFWKRSFWLTWGTSCLFTTSIWQVLERLHVVYGSWFSWRHEFAPFLHWRSQIFSKGCYHHDLKAFCETGYNMYFRIL